MSGLDQARIGPNVVLQLIAALSAAPREQVAAIFSTAGQSDWLLHPPASMVDERAAARLHQTLRQCLDSRDSARILRQAGRLTADYLLANRIPRPAQTLLRRLPDLLAARLLTAAIRRNAWTFAGSGQFSADGLTYRLAGNPLCRGERGDHPLCAWHAAVFERLFQRLVNPDTEVREIACQAEGAEACLFDIDIRAADRR